MIRFVDIFQNLICPNKGFHPPYSPIFFCYTLSHLNNYVILLKGKKIVNMEVISPKIAQVLQLKEAYFWKIVNSLMSVKNSFLLCWQFIILSLEQYHLSHFWKLKWLESYKKILDGHLWHAKSQKWEKK